MTKPTDGGEKNRDQDKEILKQYIKDLENDNRILKLQIQTYTQMTKSIIRDKIPYEVEDMDYEKLLEELGKQMIKNKKNKIE